MNQKAVNIIDWLANDADYFAGLKILQQNRNPAKGPFQNNLRRDNPFNRAKLVYLLIRDLNNLTGLSFTEQNYKEMIKPYISKKGQQLIIDPNSETKAIIEETKEDSIKAINKDTAIRLKKKLIKIPNLFKIIINWIKSNESKGN
jgi:hypothetical protein